MKIGIGLGLNYRGGGAGSANPLYAVSAFNTLGTETSGSGTNVVGREDIIFKVHHVIGGGDVSKIVLSMNNWAMGTTSTDGLNLPTHGCTIKEMWLVSEAGAYVQVRRGGATTWTIAANDNDIQSDDILPSAFSLSVFARNMKFALAVRCIPVDSGGTLVIGGKYASTNSSGTTQLTPGQLNLTAPADTYPVGQLQTYNGALSATGTGGGGACLPIIMLGTYVSAAPPVYMGIGDSIVAYVGDTATALKPTSFFGRALVNSYASPTVYRAGLKAARPSGDARFWAAASANGAQARMAYWCRYANVMVERYGVNNRSYPSQYNAKEVIWAQFLANHGGTKVKRVAVALSGSTTSTDSWATLVNQTLGSETGPSGALASMNNDALATVGTNLDHYLETLGIRGNADKAVNDYWRWATGPTTADGLHPNSTAHELMAVDLRILMTTIESGW